MKINQIKLRCINPFYNLELQPYGEVFTCCPSMTRIGPIGNIKNDSVEQIWNSPKAKYLRKKVLEDDLESICLKSCPFYRPKGKYLSTKLLKKDVSSKLLKEIFLQKTILEYGPDHLVFGFSGGCNLRCKMCLSNAHFIREDEPLKNIIYKRELPTLLPKIRKIMLNGNGDLFYQKETRELLQGNALTKYPNLSVDILTNGMLFSTKMWESIKHNQIYSISVSLDAATKETYEKIRRGGIWETVRMNLEVISNLRENDEIKEFGLNFVVMKSNLDDMIAFYDLARRLNCDYVTFQKVCGLKNINEWILNIEDRIKLRNNLLILEKVKSERTFFGHSSIK